MIVVCDVNTIWRHRPFAALSEQTRVLGISPCDGRSARKALSSTAGPMEVLKMVLPRGWASKTAWLGQRILWWKIRVEAKKRGERIEGIVVTSPHYLTLLSLIPTSVKKIYYASDDYRNYDGWDDMDVLEKKMMKLVDHSFFISELLAKRAKQDYGINEASISVSMNGTEPRFFPQEGEVLPVAPPCGKLLRPVAGIVGGINSRLDFELLRACADLPELGTLALIGPLPEPLPDELRALLVHPKCVSVGMQPHETIHLWFKCLDVGLVPYVKSDFNALCSPMRLYDHLATGSPVVATDACDQVVRCGFPEVSVCAGADSFLEVLATRLGESENAARRLLSEASFDWGARATALWSTISTLPAPGQSLGENNIEDS